MRCHLVAGVILDVRESLGTFTAWGQRMAWLRRAGAASVIEVGVIGCLVNELFVDGGGFMLSGQSQESSLVLVAGGLGANAIDPVLCVAFAQGFEAVIRRWGKDTENMPRGRSGRLDRRDGGHFRQGNGDSEAGGFLVLVYGKEVRSQDEVGWFP